MTRTGKGFVICMICAAMLLGICCPFVAQAEEDGLVFTPEELAYIEEADTIKVGSLPNYIPFSYTDAETGEARGIFPDLIRRMAELTGLKLEPWLISPNTRPADALRSGEVSMVMGMVKFRQLEEEGAFLFSDTVMEQVLVTVKRKGMDYQTFEGTRVVIPYSFQYADEYLKENYQNVDIVYARDADECFDMIAKGKADLTLRDSYMSNYFLQKPRYDRLTVEADMSIPQPACIVFRNDVDDRLYSIMNKVIAYTAQRDVNELTIANTVALNYRYSFWDVVYLYRFPLALCVLLALCCLVFVCLYSKHRAKYKISEIERDSLRQKSQLDELTGLYNRAAFYREAYDRMSGNPSQKYMIVALNIERFKIVNELYGTKEGDKLLQCVGEGLSAQAGQLGGICARIDSDRFVCCLPESEEAPEKLRKSIRKQINEGPWNMNITVCLGIYHVKNLQREISGMCDRAFLAAASVKGNYQKHIAEYDDEHRKMLIQEQEVLNEAAGALSNREFQIYLQPKNNVLDRKLVGAEALIRWIHPVKGVVPPGQFLPVFEHNGFIEQIDKFVLEEVCRLLQKWKQEGKPLIPISVNLSRTDFYNKKLCSNIINLVEKYEVDPTYVEFEVTETAYSHETEFIYDVLKQLKSYGFKVLMDDFGSGYSSLNMLKDAPVDVIKMDLRFLDKSDEWGRSKKIVRAIIQLAGEIGIPVIAEGVETEEQVNFLGSTGCDWAQGYYFSRPVAVAQFEKNWIDG